MLGGTVVTVSGSSFVISESLSCRFGKKIVAARYLSPTGILCSAPMQTEGTADVVLSVTNNLVDFDTQSATFTYHAPPSVTAVSPKVLPVSTTTSITITGANLSAVGDAAPSCRLSGSAGTVDGSIRKAKRISDTTVTCLVFSNSSGVATVEISRNGEDFTRDGAVVHFVPMHPRGYNSPTILHLLLSILCSL